MPIAGSSRAGSPRAVTLRDHPAAMTRSSPHARRAAHVPARPAAASVPAAADGIVDPDWPLRAFSRIVAVGPVRWHVQHLPAAAAGAPRLLLVHGSGAATHSWRALLPLLQAQFEVVAVDLPGHGFTSPLPTAPTLPAVVAALAALLEAIDLAPDLVVGHSAGAAIAVKMALDGRIAPRAIVSLNGAFVPFRGLPGMLFAPLARLLTVGGVAPWLFALRARDPAAVRLLIASTGSTVDAEGQALYARLLQRPAHVASTLSMMAHWDLAPLLARMSALRVRLWLVTGSLDGTVPPAQADEVQARLPAAERVRLAGLGHLAHEEDAAAVATVVRDCARAVGLLPRPPASAQSRTSA
jgi:magnesium chelatase accessory protein